MEACRPGPSWRGDFNPGWRVIVADVNHDGYADIVSSYNGESMNVMLGGKTGFVPPAWQPVASCECDFTFVIADINRDGNPDIVINSVEGTELEGMLFVLPGHGDGKFAGRTTRSTAPTRSHSRQANRWWWT